MQPPNPIDPSSTVPPESELASGHAEGVAPEPTLPDGDRSATPPSVEHTDPYQTAHPGAAHPSADPYQTAGGTAPLPDSIPVAAEEPKAALPKLPGYDILEILGQGGMGTVYKARHLRMKRMVALKVIRRDQHVSPQTQQRFNQEIEAAAQLTHPNVVMAYDANEVDGVLYFVMEYIEGVDLGKLLRDHGPFRVEQACDYVRQAALGLQHAHERGLVHRDIKPSNLLLTKGEGLVKILDMGLARLHESIDQPASQLTGTGVVMGTPDFMSPEQARDSRSVDIRSDLYSLGCTFYCLLTGRVLFPEGTYTEKLLKHVMDQPTPVTALRDDVPAAVADIVAKLLAKRPEDRYQTPADLADALEPFVPARSATMRSSAASIKFGPPATASGKIPQGLQETTFAMTAAGQARAALPPERQTVLDDGPPVAVPLPRTPRKSARAVVGILLGLTALVAVALGVTFLGNPAKEKANTGAMVEGPTDTTTTRPPVETMVATRPVPTRPTLPIATKPEVPVKPLSGVLVRFDKPLQAGTLRTALSPNGEWALASFDGRIHLWRVPLHKRADKPADVLITVFPANALAVEDNGERVLIGRPADDPATPIGKVPPVIHFVTTWDPKASANERFLRGHKDAVSAVALSPKGNFGVSGAGDRGVRLWDLTNRTPKGVLGEHDAKVRCVALSNDSHYALSGDVNGTVTLWDLETNKKVKDFARHKGIVTAVAFSPDGRYAASGGFDGSLHVYDLAKKEWLHSLEGHTDVVRGLAFLPDVEQFLSGSQDGSLRLWNVNSREEIRKYDEHNVGVLSVAPSADGKYAVFICADQTIRRCELPEKKP